ncbi:MAG: hypothetical protein JWQ88_487 [Rhodoferax sp.]|nr:hypothetical protein [Rhodoferax sp.]
MFWTWLRGVAVLPLVCLVACRPAEGPAAQETLEETHARGSSAVSMRGYNYTEEGVQEFYVNGARVSNLPPHGGGGADACCAMLPNVWKEGMTVNLDWTIGHYTVPWTQRKDLSVEEERRCCWSERTLQQTVSIRRYDKPSTLQVFFLLGDKLEVWVSPYDLGHPDHPSGRKYPVDTGAPPKYLERRIRQEKQP